MRTPFPFLAGVLFAAMLVGCSAPRQQTSSEPPALVIVQLPDYPMPGRDSDFPGGLVAAFWRDGRMILCTDPKSIGKSYVEGVVAPQQREELLSFLSTTAIVRAPKVEGIPLHAATQDITIRSDGSTSRWTRIVPDTESVWREVELRLFSLSFQHSLAVASSIAEGVIRER